MMITKFQSCSGLPKKLLFPFDNAGDLLVRIEEKREGQNETTDTENSWEQYLLFSR